MLIDKEGVVCGTKEQLRRSHNRNCANKFERTRLKRKGVITTNYRRNMKERKTSEENSKRRTKN